MPDNEISIRSKSFRANISLAYVDQLPLRNWRRLAKMLQETWYPENEQTRKRLDVWFPEQIQRTKEDWTRKDMAQKSCTKSTDGLRGAALKARKDYNRALLRDAINAKKKYEKNKQMYEIYKGE